MAMAGEVVNRLCHSVFKRHNVMLDLKLRLFNTCVLPVVTYGSESWTITRHGEEA